MLPSITPDRHGSAAARRREQLLVVAQNGKLGAQIEDAFLPDLASRRKLAAARVPSWSTSRSMSS